MAGDELNAAIVAGRALRSAGRLQRAQISVRHGFVAAIPVAGMLALGTVVGQPVAAVTMAVGAMLAGVAWLAGGGEARPLGTMVGAALGVVVATMLGTLSGRLPWLHLGLLFCLCLVAGLLSALARRGSVVGTQSVIAFVVFGRFPEPLTGAAELAGLAAFGAASQIAVAALVALSPAWRAQRAAVADAYERLAELAAAPGSSRAAAAAALDGAEQRLSAPSLLADAGVTELSNLVQEGRRIRLSLGVLGMMATRGQGDRDPAGAPPEVTGVLRAAERVLSAIAAGAREPRTPPPEVDVNLDGQLEPGVRELVAALVGQLNAAARMAARAQDGAGLRLPVHPSRGSRLPLIGLASDLQTLRANATLSSAAGRHAVRLAVVVAGTELLIQHVALPRAYWAVVAAATVLRPEFGATITRGAERVAGTCLGVVLATMIAVALKPDGWGITAIVGVLAWATYALFPASFAAGVAGLTAMVVFLLHAVAPDSATIALDRGIDTLIGGAIGVAAYMLWPTWSGTSLGLLLADVADAQRGYLRDVLAGLISGEELADARLRPLARRARTAYGHAEAAITLARSEPVRGVDPYHAAAVLGGLRRVVYGVHALRITRSASAARRPLRAVAPLASGFDDELELIAERLRGSERSAPVPGLRTLFEEATRALPRDAAATVCTPLDELVDAINTVAGQVGLTAG